MDKKIEFPKDFIWGTAVCSHQAEGYNEHSDWWAWEKQGKITDGTVSGPAADMLNRYPEDFAMMEELGYNGFRMSIEWARVEPRPGEFSEEALTHYENVLKEMRRRNIKVCMTLYHWTLPKWFADRGGWTSHGAAERFRKFVRVVAERLFDLVDIWCTLNEPTAPLYAGFLMGEYPPEEKSFPKTAKVFRTLLRAHAAAYEEICREAARRGAPVPPIGIAHAVVYFEPKNKENILERRVCDLLHFMHNSAFTDSMKTGRVPFPFGHGQRIPGLAGSYTYMGVNYYIRMRPNLPPKKFPPATLEDWMYQAPELGYTLLPGMEVYPPGFYLVLKDMADYGVPIYITENGLPDEKDDRRRAYVLQHLAQLNRAMRDGIDVRGYFQWSWIDNFEWKHGWVPKLGVIELDRETMERKPRPSAYMYSRIARTGEITPELVREYAPHVECEIF